MKTINDNQKHKNNKNNQETKQKCKPTVKDNKQHQKTITINKTIKKHMKIDYRYLKHTKNIKNK